MKRFIWAMLFLSSSLTVMGQVIGDFSLTDVRNEEEVSLASFSDKKAVVVIFTSLTCPFDQYYQERLADIATNYNNSEIQVLFINSIPSESVDQLKSEVSTLNAPYLADKQQVVMRLLDASKSPEAIILIPVNGGFRKLYQGAIDNNPQVATDVKKPYLIENLKDLLAGEPLTYGDVLPVGCRIRTP